MSAGHTHATTVVATTKKCLLNQKNCQLSHYCYGEKNSLLTPRGKHFFVVCVFRGYIVAWSGCRVVACFNVKKRIEQRKFTEKLHGRMDKLLTFWQRASCRYHILTQSGLMIRNSGNTANLSICNQGLGSGRVVSLPWLPVYTPTRI